MAIITATDLYGTVEALLINDDPDTDLTSVHRERVTVTWEGFEGEAHCGLTRPSCSRVRMIHPKRGTEIRNARQITILSAEELAEVAAAMDLQEVKPEWVGANVVLHGIPQFTRVPPSSRLAFEGGVVITIDMENGPCRYPGEIIERHHPGKGAAFPKVALGKRGVTAWVEKTGEIALGERCRLFVPPQRIYEPASSRNRGARPARAAE